jgi:hypothetical protein
MFGKQIENIHICRPKKYGIGFNDIDYIIFLLTKFLWYEKAYFFTVSCALCGYRAAGTEFDVTLHPRLFGSFGGQYAFRNGESYRYGVRNTARYNFCP